MDGGTHSGGRVCADRALAAAAFAAALVAVAAVPAHACVEQDAGAVTVAAAVDGDTVRLADGTLVRLADVGAPKADRKSVV